MGARAIKPWSGRRALTTWLALWLLLMQSIGVDAFQRPMDPIQYAGGARVICTAHGLQSLPRDDGVPTPADRRSPSCPCCLPFTVWGGADLVAVAEIPAPDWVTAPFAPLPAVAPSPPRFAANRQQPRAPPVSV